MTNYTGNGVTANSPRLIGSMFAALLITFSLFVLMHKLTAQDNLTASPSSPILTIDPVFNQPPASVTEKTKIKPLQPPKTIPQPIRPMQQTSAKNALMVEHIDIATPGFQLSNADNLLAVQEGSARPIIRIAPKYPNQAAVDGLEGWVKLEFSIDASGRVKHIKVTDAEPKRVFEQEAIRALKKWKYKPTIINGVAVEQQGVQIVLDFKLQA